MPRTAAKKPRKPKKPPVALLAPGTLLLSIRWGGRAIPWKAPTVTRHGATFKDGTLVAWQQEVALRAMAARKISKPYEGPVEVKMVARFAKGPIGDACNLLKAAEDSLQGVVFVNDRQVVVNSCDRRQAGYDMVAIVVRAAEPTED